MMSYYSDAITEKSLQILQSLVSGLDFVLVGGWAVNFYTNNQKSTDIDIAITVDKLSYFKQFGVKKYDNAPLYYAYIGETRIDLLVNGITDKMLTVPISSVLSDYVTIGGFKVAGKEILLILKMCAYFSPDKQKIEKDMIDVDSMLFYAGINMPKVAEYTKKYKIDSRKSFGGMLEYLDKGRNLWQFITNTKEEYETLLSKTKKAIKPYIRSGI
ncbi:MAG: hypothetical protein QXL94_04775 [Candidatus Parvarchaeum sp.]